MRRKDDYDEIAEDIVFGETEFKRLLTSGQAGDDELANALAMELRKRFGGALEKP